MVLSINITLRFHPTSFLFERWAVLDSFAQMKKPPALAGGSSLAGQVAQA